MVFHHLVKLSEEEPRCSVKRVSGLFTLGVFLINFTQLALLNFCSFHVRLDHSPPHPTPPTLYQPAPSDHDAPCTHHNHPHLPTTNHPTRQLPPTPTPLAIPPASPLKPPHPTPAFTTYTTPKPNPSSHTRYASTSAKQPI